MPHAQSRINGQSPFVFLSECDILFDTYYKKSSCVWNIFGNFCCGCGCGVVMEMSELCIEKKRNLDVWVTILGTVECS